MLDLSVVIATYKRRDTLKVTLECLARQTVAATRYEVIVVDDGSPDDTQALVESLISVMPYKLRYYRHANRGPGATENRGIQEAAAKLVLLIADDVQPAPGLLEQHLAAHARRPADTIAVLGRVLQSPDLPHTHFQRNWDPFKFKYMQQPTEVPYWKFWACNISVKRSFLLENGLFTELKGAAHEDVELGYRLSLKGLRIFYEPEALAYHYHVETLASATARAYERGLNWRFLEDRVPDPQLHVLYHTPQAIKCYFHAVQNPGTSTLPTTDRMLPLLVGKQVLRGLIFNRHTVSLFWLPVLRRAEHNRLCRLLGNAYTYRLVVHHHFFKGCAEQEAAYRALSESSAAQRAGTPHQ